MTRLILEGFAGPGGWSEALRRHGRHRDAAGVEWDHDACHTAVAAGHRRVQADVAAFPVAHLAGQVEGIILSPPCPLFSKAGQRLGIRVMNLLLDAVAPMLAGDDVRPAVRDAVYPHALAEQERRNQARPAATRWPTGKVDAAARADAAQAALVLEPARWARELRPRWLVCEQVPDVLPLWREYVRRLRQAGWAATAGVLSAEQFGVPQTRKRASLVARSDGRPARLPAPTHRRYVPARRADEPAADGLFDEPARSRAVHPSDRDLLPWVSMAEALCGIDAARPARTIAGQRSPRWAYGAGPASYDTGWTLETEQRSDTAAGRVPVCRRHDQPAPTLVANADRWEIQSSSRLKVNDRTRPWGGDEPAMTVAFGHSDMRIVYRNGNQANSAERSSAEPAPTVHFGPRGNAVDWVMRTNQVPGGTGEYQRRDGDEPAPTVSGQAGSWALERPATAVCGDPRLAGPGHRDREGGQRQYDQHTARVEVWQAGVLQSFPADYPWQGTRTSQYRQCGNAVPVLLGAAVLGEVLDRP